MRLNSAYLNRRLFRRVEDIQGRVKRTLDAILLLPDDDPVATDPRLELLRQLGDLNDKLGEIVTQGIAA